MPTGYTACVGEGATFEEFVWGCARNFGALIMMRDDAHDAEVPDEFQPSDYHSTNIERLNRELADIQGLTTEQCLERCKALRDEAVLHNEKHASDHHELRAKYDAMIVKVLAWTPPSEDHVDMKRFMLQQLRESIKFDCSGDPYQEPLPPLDGEEWRTQKLAYIQKTIAYQSDALAKDTARTNERNRWVKQLRDSVPDPKKQPVAG